MRFLQVGLVVRRRHAVDPRRAILARQPVGLGHPFQVDDVVQRGEDPVRLLPRQFGYPSSFRGQVRGTQCSLPCFASMGLVARRPPFLRRVPARPVPRLPRYYEAATTSRRACPSAYGFASGFRTFPALRARRGAPDGRRVPVGPGALFSRRSRAGSSRTGANGTSQAPWSPIPRLCRAPRPRSNRSSSPIADFPVLPPGPTHRRLRREHDFEADTRLQRPLSTLHDAVADTRARTRFRLAGCASAGRVSNPLGHDERFPITSFPLSRAFPDASWAHLRRDFHDIWKATASPLAKDALERIGRLYDIEGEIVGQPAERRREARQNRSRPHVDAFRLWCESQLARVPTKGDLAKAMRYALKRWDAFTLFLKDGRIAIDNNPAERAIRPVAIGRKTGFLPARTPAARPSPTQ